MGVPEEEVRLCLPWTPHAHLTSDAVVHKAVYVLRSLSSIMESPFQG